MESQEKQGCQQFLKEIFLKKEYRNIITFEPENEKELQEKTLDGLLEGNELYKNEHELKSIYDVKDLQEFVFENTYHETQVNEKIKIILEKEQEAYSQSIARRYKNYILSNIKN